MDLKEKLLSFFLVLENEVNTDLPVHEVRNQALKSFETLGFPNKKLEAWKYTSLDRVLDMDFALSPNVSEGLEYKDVKKYFIHQIDSYKVVFVNGVYSSHLSETSHDGYDICIMSSALDHKKYSDTIDSHFNKIANTQEHMTALNTAFAKEGAYIHVPKNKIIPKPIQVVFLYTDQQKSCMLQPRNLVILEEGAQAQIIERHQNISNQKVLTNTVTEIFVNDRAYLDYYKIQDDDIDNSYLVDSTYIHQEKNSNASVHTFSFGGNIVRNNLQYFQEGSHLDSILKGITIIGDRQHVDHHTLVHHKNPDNESHQDYKGIFSDRSTGVFNGKIMVDQKAQKTNAFQNNNNILLDDKATINTKPQLEIFADDVKCSHGCTIGQLDKKALFYLQSRGIPLEDAQAIMMLAFANDALESIKIPELKAQIHRLIADKIGVSIGFEL